MCRVLFHSTNLKAFLMNGLVRIDKYTLAMGQKMRFELALCIVITKKRYQNLSSTGILMHTDFCHNKGQLPKEQKSRMKSFHKIAP